MAFRLKSRERKSTGFLLPGDHSPLPDSFAPEQPIGQAQRLILGRCLDGHIVRHIEQSVQQLSAEKMLIDIVAGKDDMTDA